MVSRSWSPCGAAVKLVKKKAIFNVEPKPVMERQGRYRLLATDIFGVFQYLRWSSSEFSQYFPYHSLQPIILARSGMGVHCIFRFPWWSYDTLPGAVIAMDCPWRLQQVRRVPSSYIVLNFIFNKHDCSHDSSLTCHFIVVCQKKYTCRNNFKSIVNLCLFKKVEITCSPLLSSAARMKRVDPSSDKRVRWHQKLHKPHLGG